MTRISKKRMRLCVAIATSGILFFAMCTDTLNTASPQISQNISESKKRGVFLAEYETSIVSIDTSKYKLNIEIQEVWVEHVWKYKSKSGAVESFETMQLVLHPVNSQILDSYLIDWGLCIDSDCQSGSGSGNLEMRVTEADSSLLVDVVKFASKYDFNNSVQVGTIQLTKK